MSEDVNLIFAERARRLIAIRRNPQYLQAAKIVYKNNPVTFINDWLTTYDPQRTPHSLPFILFPKQAELVNFFHERNIKREDGICEKSRNVGVTWVAVAYAVYLFLFHAEQKISFGSRKESLVDELGNPDSIFEKIRMALMYLPHEFMPPNFDMQKHARYLKIFNPDNASIITGEAGDNIGRGGRSTIYFLDEHAFLLRANKIEAAISENSDCKIYISTPNGIGNVFYMKRHSGKFPVFTFNYYDDPRKDAAWFKKKQENTDPVILAQEVLIDYSASLPDVVIPTRWINAAVNFEMIGIDEGELFAGLDVADEGGDSNAIVYRKGLKVLGAKQWKEGTTKETSLKAYNCCSTWIIKYLMYDSIGVGAGVKAEFKSLKQEIKDFQLEVNGVNVGKRDLLGNYENEKRNKDMFTNLKAMLWWQVRRRFEKTYEHVSGIKKHDVKDLISIPNDSELIRELSSPLFLFDTSGKLQIESKKNMKKRGLKSPNLADAFILAFAKLNDIKVRMLQ